MASNLARCPSTGRRPRSATTGRRLRCGCCPCPGNTILCSINVPLPGGSAWTGSWISGGFVTGTVCLTYSGVVGSSPAGCEWRYLESSTTKLNAPVIGGTSDQLSVSVTIFSDGSAILNIGVSKSGGGADIAIYDHPASPCGVHSFPGGSGTNYACGSAQTWDSANAWQYFSNLVCPAGLTGGSVVTQFTAC